MLYTAAGMLSLTLLGFVCGYGRGEIALGVCFCRLFRIRRLQSLFWVTLAYLLLARPFLGFVPTHWPDSDMVLTARYGECHLADPAVKYFGVLARCLLGYAVFLLLRRFSMSRRLVLLHLITFGLILISPVLFNSEPVAAGITMYFLQSFCWFLPILAYLLVDYSDCGPRHFLTLYLMPFFETSPNPQPVLDLPCQEADEEDPTLLRRSIMLSLIFSLVIGLTNLIQAVLFHTRFYGHVLSIPWAPIPDLAVTGLAPSLLDLYPRWQVLLAVLWGGLHRITGYMVLGVFIECCRLMLGYDVPRRFTSPWKANSFGEFYRCIMPYYIIFMNRIYLQPIYNYLRSHGWGRKWGFEMAVWLSIFAANFTTHVIKDVQLAGLIGGGEYLWRSLVTDFSYCLVLFIGLRFMGLPKLLARRLPVPAKFFFLLFLYSLVILSRTGGIWVSPLVRLRFAGALFLGL